MRVADALDRVAEILDTAAADGSDAVEFIHGFGTGALRKAVREFLQASAYVSDYQAGEKAGRGGDGVTIALLRGGDSRASRDSHNPRDPSDPSDPHD
jgi:DNA mismatch repair protein MutS2